MTLQDADTRRKEIGAEIARLKKEVRDLDRFIRENCPHEEAAYWPDPSGNSDSGYKCTFCGAWL